MKNRLLFLLFLLAYLPSSVSAQCLKIDSLRQLLLLPNLADTSRINVLNVMSQEYLHNKQPYYALTFAQQAYQLSKNKDYKVGMGDALVMVGKVNFQSDDVTKRDTECVPNYNKALELYNEAKANDRMAVAYKSLAEYYNSMSYQQKEYEQQALDNYLLYLRAAEKSGDKISLAEAYETVGYLYETLGNDKKSTEYFLKVLSLKQELEQKGVKSAHLLAKTQNFYNLQLENQRLFSYILIGGAILLGAIILVLYILLSYRYKAHKLLERQKEEIQIQKENIEASNVELAQRNEEISAQRDQLADQTEKLAIAQTEIIQANKKLTNFVQHLEQIVAQRTEQLQKSNQLLIDTNRELDILIYRASHDFKGPVATLTGLSQIGKMECNEFLPALDILERIENVVQKMDKMLEKLHQVSYIIGKELELAPINLEEIVENTTNTLDRLLETSPIQIKTEIAPNFRLDADAEMLEMMLENVVENAALYRRADALPAPALYIKAESDESFATITIEDNGLGIASNFIHKTFEMFSRGTELAKGNGLGLYVVKQGLERLFGKEQIESVEGIYTRITLTFDKKSINFDYRANLLDSLDWEEDE